MTDKQKTANALGTALLCAGLLCVFLGERVLGQDMARNVGSGFGVLLLLVAAALRINAFSRSRADVRGVEARLLAAYAGVFAALLLYALSTDASFQFFKVVDAQKAHAQSVLFALWPALLSVSLSALLFMELVYAGMPIAASVELRRVRTASYAGLTLAFSVVFLLSMNYVAGARDVRRDLSYFKTTQPSAASLHMLDKLEVPVKAILFWRPNDDVLQQIRPYFAALAKQNTKFRYEVLDSAFAPELCRKHHVNGNGAVLLLQGDGDTQKGQSIPVGNELTEARANLRKFDGLFQQNFTKLARAERAVSLSVGHGERNATSDDTKPGEGTQVMDQVWKRLNIKTSKLGMAQGLAAAVPDSAGAVVITGPREKFIPEEVQTLLNYVRKGGRLMIMLDSGADDGLDPLLAGLGLARLSGTLTSDKFHVRRAHDNTDKTLIYSNKYSSHPTVTTVSRFSSEVATIFVGGVAIDRGTAQGLTSKSNVTFPLRTGPGFYRDLDGDFERDANEQEESLNMVAAVTVSEKEGAPEGRVVVIGDGDFMTDKVATNNGNVMLFVDSLAWLIGNEELNAEVSSEEDIPIEHSRGQDKIWFYATTFAVPLPLLGLAAWVGRAAASVFGGELMKGVLWHGLLAFFGLVFAYQTYNRKPEEDAAPGSVTAVECSADALQQVTLRTPTLEVTVEPKREHDASTYWITSRQRTPDEDKPKADKPADAAKPAAAVADATKPAAAVADATKPDATKKEPPEAQKPKHYLANATFADYVKRVAPMRALRSLGALPKERDADFGFDKVTTSVKLQCAGRTTDFEVGARAFGASQRYFRDTKTKTTYLFDEQVVSDLESANFKFMQTDLHVFPNDEVEELTISAHGAKKRLLHRDRKLADQALWVDASAPAKRNELYNNWFSRLARLRARVYLPEGAEPGSDLKVQGGGTEPVLTIEYKVADKPNGKLELVRVDENGVGHYYARTETTRNWVSLFDSAAKEVEQDVGMVVGTEQAPSKPADAANSNKPAPPAGHGSGSTVGSPAGLPLAIRPCPPPRPTKRTDRLATSVAGGGTACLRGMQPACYRPMSFPQIVFGTPRKLPKPRDLKGRVAVLDIAFASSGSGASFEGTTKPFIDGLGDRLAIWIDHHDHIMHAAYANDPRFVLRTKLEHGACPEMVTAERVQQAGAVDTICCHTDFDGLCSAAKWIRSGREPYEGADDDARAIDTRLGKPSERANTMDRALRARPRDDALRGLIVRFLAAGCEDIALYREIEKASDGLRVREDEARRIARGYEVRNDIALVEVPTPHTPFDKTFLLLLGQERARISIVIDEHALTVAARFDSGIDLLAQLGLEGGMPTVVSVAPKQREEVLAKLGWPSG